VRVKPRERFSSEVTLNPLMVSAFAASVGDTNPVHHDPEFAAATRYKRLIASGTHTSALLLGLTASHFSKRGSMVGLEFWLKFRRPVYADETIFLEWLVVKVTPNQKLKGDVVGGAETARYCDADGGRCDQKSPLDQSDVSCFLRAQRAAVSH
jgi:3-hydroxybutyryl-CoA dehydratase